MLRVLFGKQSDSFNDLPNFKLKNLKFKFLKRSKKPCNHSCKYSTEKTKSTKPGSVLFHFKNNKLWMADFKFTFWKENFPNFEPKFPFLERLKNSLTLVNYWALAVDYLNLSMSEEGSHLANSVNWNRNDDVGRHEQLAKCNNFDKPTSRWKGSE